MVRVWTLLAFDWFGAGVRCVTGQEGLDFGESCLYLASV